MIKVLAEGIVWGLILSFMIGPVFFGLIHTSIHKGFRKALVYAFGVASSDTFFILITYFGIAGFLEDTQFRKIMLATGGVIMLAFGIYYMIKKVPDSLPVENEKKQIRKTNMWLKGFILNAINPSVFIFWIGMVSITSVNYQHSRLLIFLFFTSTILTVFGTDALKAFIADKIKIYFTNRLLNKMNKVLGLVILLAGLRLIYDYFEMS
ncbi:MAG TPA: LysE family transporter [Cytophagaceae bacterium]|jgi:threonine/homoserine/homoserine lactone efflux protein|nr:LysE family transporter [Cytophagaceae bacterium]